MNDLPPEYEDDYLYGWRIKPFDYVGDKIIMFGYPLFGGWLPYAEFYTWWEYGDRVCNIIEVSWFTYGFVISYNYNEELL